MDIGLVHHVDVVCLFTPSVCRYQVILLGDRSIWVWTTCPRFSLYSAVARARTTDHSVTRPIP